MGDHIKVEVVQADKNFEIESVSYEYFLKVFFSVIFFENANDVILGLRLFFI